MPATDYGDDYNPWLDKNMRAWERYYVGLGCTKWKASSLAWKKRYKECRK